MVLSCSCPVCRYCQTPEEVADNRCMKCGSQEVNTFLVCSALLAQLVACQIYNLNFSPGVTLNPNLPNVCHVHSVEIGHEIISMAILSLPQRPVRLL